MKKLFLTLIFGAVICIGFVLPGIAKREQPKRDTSINEVLRAHNVPQDKVSFSVFSSEALKLKSIYSDVDKELPNFYERVIEVSIDGNSFKNHQVAPLGVREETDVFDGRAAFHAEVEKGAQVEAYQMGDQQLRAAQLNIKTFGLVPVLNLLLDPETRTAALGRTARQEDKFELKTAAESWIIYADQWHIIRRLIAGDRIIDYGDYRLVEGIQLPFVQRVYQGGKLSYELIFKEIELNRDFASGYFKRDTLSR